MIEISNVAMTFFNGMSNSGERFDALKNVSLKIEKGCIYGFLGSNGAGKSTLMRLLCGVYKPHKGSVKIDDEDVFDNPHAKEKIFFVNDETFQYTNFNLNGLKKYYSNFYPKFSEEVFDRLKEELNLPDGKKLSQFSKGMKRQALVITALACMTDYVMLDEAFDGLDPATRKLIKRIIVDEMVDRNATLIISSHNINEISEICDHAMLIHKGEMIFADEIDNITSGIKKVQIVRKDSPISLDDIKALGLEVMDYSTIGCVASVIIKSNDELDTILSKLDDIIFEIIPLTLEEIFIYEMEARGYGREIL